MIDPYIRKFKRLVRVIDGDTLIAEVDLGYRCYSDQHFRLLGVDTPESNSKDPYEREKAVQATNFTINWFPGHGPAIYIRSQKADAFGRYLAEFICECGANLSEDLIKAGLGVPYRV